MVAQGVAHDAGTEAYDKGLLILQHGDHHWHKGWRVDERHRRHSHRICIDTHNAAEQGVEHERAEDRNSKEHYLVEAVGELELREVGHRGHGDAKYIYKVHSEVEATLETLHRADERRQDAQGAQNEDEDDHKPLPGEG